MPEDREPNAPDMPHADTRTPLHGPTGGVPSDKALSDMDTHNHRHKASCHICNRATKRSYSNGSTLAVLSLTFVPFQHQR
eukprot:scaffold14782_cov146-Isochrysis_galbana.AAC.5